MSACAICPMRAGVRLTELKARIFDAIKRGGPAGIEADELFALVLQDRGVKREDLKTHVAQINQRLLLSDTKIVSDGRRYGSYWLEKRRTDDAATQRSSVL